MPADPEVIGAVVNAISETLGRLEVPEQKLLEIALAVQERWPMRRYTGAGMTRRNRYGAS